MANKEKSRADFLNEKVTIRLFKDSKNYRDDLVVGLNGEMYKIKRGVEVAVPRKIALLIEQAERSTIEAATNLEKQVKEFAETKL